MEAVSTTLVSARDHSRETTITMPTRPAVNRPPGPVQRHTDRKLSPRQRGYTHRWSDYSRSYLAEHPLCYYCSILGRVIAAQATDHYNPAAPDTPEFWDPNNHRPACHWHNGQKGDTPGDVYVARIKAHSATVATPGSDTQKRDTAEQAGAEASTRLP
jgi:5-methylcytosine-specific restriction endonuclease McrA